MREIGLAPNISRKQDNQSTICFTMSGRINPFYGKRQSTSKKPGNKPNSQRQRVLAARQRKKTAKWKRELERQRKSALAQQKQQENGPNPTGPAGLDA
jgi:hypothetical protein